MGRGVDWAVQDVAQLRQWFEGRKPLEMRAMRPDWSLESIETKIMQLRRGAPDQPRPLQRRRTSEVFAAPSFSALVIIIIVVTLHLFVLQFSHDFIFGFSYFTPDHTRIYHFHTVSAKFSCHLSLRWTPENHPKPTVRNQKRILLIFQNFWKVLVTKF